MSAAKVTASAFDPHHHVRAALALNDERDELLRKLVEVENRMQPHLRELHSNGITKFRARGEIVKIRSREVCEWKRDPVTNKIEVDAAGKRVKALDANGKPKVIGVRYTMSVPSSEDILEFDF